jgi:hypothetical protein
VGSDCSQKDFTPLGELYCPTDREILQTKDEFDRRRRNRFPDRFLSRKESDMGKMRLFAMFVALTALFLSLRAQAWDDQRKGFLLGFGIGPGFT